ncbi:helix-turn-helix transcriptional regulator [Streptomyces sp. SID12501]|uniref:Helix-turn-helix transcriptional regulator n=1 Tax=Streptomyces sp. SID12501 TaxID=2706042 RepID=A0A6B3C6E1_9ACTN|nr:helix-turn-helix transcriptional regulator [Streptomyces sp. SID12501]NEC91740.1 helix-turn-helix transcriptional regulator [Streptomyces sp. SID12501]
MTDQSQELFAAVDSLLAAVDDGTVLPLPAERVRLREAAGLTRAALAQALGVRVPSIEAWEAGRAEPKGERREAYRRLLEGLAARHPAPAPPPGRPAIPAEPRSAPSVQTAVGAATAPPTAPSAHDTPHTPTPGTRRPARPTEAAPAVGSRFPNGSLAVLDADGTAYCPGGVLLECPAATIPQLADWAVKESGLGAERLHRHGKDSDPLIVLTARAAARFGLPPALEDRRALRLADNHPVVRELARAKWKLTRRGFGPWARVYRPAEGGRRQCVQLAVLPWNALDTRTWGSAGQLPAPELAQILGDYATRVITPRGSAAVCGLELLTALRPPTRPVKDPATDTWMSGPNPGALTQAVDPAPPEAPDEHPVVTACSPRGHQRTPADVLDEEAFEWIRDPEQLTDDECAKPFAVGIDVNMAFAAAVNRLTVGLGAPVHVNHPRFDKKTPGSWLVDLSHINLDTRLPNPFTPHGLRPEGPAWYATPTVAYAAELGCGITPLEAWLRPESGSYLDGWYTRLRDAYLATMERLGVSAGMSEADFLAAMEHHKGTDPAQVAVLSAIKATVKGGIGKLRERPQGAGYRPGERWPALERPTWRPDIRAAVIATARVNMHRKMLKLAATGLFPIAVLSDCAVYLSDGPTPLDFLPRTPEGKPLPGGFRLGVSPGMVKHEGTQSLLWAVKMLDEGHNPARHIKGADAAAGGE